MSEYLICSVERSGSTLLSALLESTHALGKPVVEPFNMQVEAAAFRKYGFESYSEYIVHARNSAASRNGVVGMNLMWRHMARLIPRLRLDAESSSRSDLALLQRHLPGLSHFIFTERRDVLAQAVSWAIAYQTDRWRSTDPPNGIVPEYDFALINALHQNVVSDNFAWETWFKGNGVAPHRMVYEDWVLDPIDATRSVSRYLGLEEGAVRLSEVDFRRQATGINREWSDRYREDLANYLLMSD